MTTKSQRISDMIYSLIEDAFDGNDDYDVIRNDPLDEPDEGAAIINVFDPFEAEYLRSVKGVVSYDFNATVNAVIIALGDDKTAKTQKAIEIIETAVTSNMNLNNSVGSLMVEAPQTGSEEIENLVPLGGTVLPISFEYSSDSRTG